MAGINLSQSIQSGRAVKRSLFDKGLVVSLILFFVVAGIWGGMRLYIKTLDDKIAVFDQELSNYSAELRGTQVDRVADFDNRLSLIAENLKDTTDPKQSLEQIEGLVIPTVVLTEYAYDREKALVTVGGETDNFKYLAQQIMSLKSQPLFGELKVDSIGKTETGRIEFSLTAKLAKNNSL